MATTHNLDTRVLGVGGVLECLNIASSFKSPRTRPFTAPEFCSNSQLGVEGGGFRLALPCWDPPGYCCQRSILPQPRRSFLTSGLARVPGPARGRTAQGTYVVGGPDTAAFQGALGCGGPLQREGAALTDTRFSGRVRRSRANAIEMGVLRWL